MNTEMMAAVLHGREDLRVQQVAVPVPRTGEVLVRVRAALTCGTDVKVFQRGYHARMIVPPALFGHELAGDIVAFGEGVRRFRLGQRVVSANSAPCLGDFPSLGAGRSAMHCAFRRSRACSRSCGMTS